MQTDLNDDLTNNFQIENEFQRGSFKASARNNITKKN